jgi:hypothetical protein
MRRAWRAGSATREIPVSDWLPLVRSLPLGAPPVSGLEEKEDAAALACIALLLNGERAPELPGKSESSPDPLAPHPRPETPATLDPACGRARMGAVLTCLARRIARRVQSPAPFLEFAAACEGSGGIHCCKSPSSGVPRFRGDFLYVELARGDVVNDAEAPALPPFPPGGASTPGAAALLTRAGPECGGGLRELLAKLAGGTTTASNEREARVWAWGEANLHTRKECASSTP